MSVAGSKPRSLELVARRDALRADADALEAYVERLPRPRPRRDRGRPRQPRRRDRTRRRRASTSIDGDRPAPRHAAEPEPPASSSYPHRDDEPATRAINLVDRTAEPVAPAEARQSAPPRRHPPPRHRASAPSPAPRTVRKPSRPPPAPTAQSSIALDTHTPWDAPAPLPESLAPETYGDSLEAGQPFSSDVVMEAQPVDSDLLDDDAFFASLRDAVRDDAPLGPVDDGFPESSAFFDDAQPEEPSRRFRRR